MPENEPGGQLGRRAGSLGRLLPGLAVHCDAGGITISGLMPRNNAVIRLDAVQFEERGFLVPL
jgi:hypothetical protein